MPILHSEDESSSGSDEGEEDSNSSSSSSDVEGSGSGRGRMLKPVFVPRKDRITIHEKEVKARIEERKLEEQRAVFEKKQATTRALVAESIRRTADAADAADMDDADEDAGLPDDTDNIDPQLELQEWKVREMARLKRDMEERESALSEKADLLRRRAMTDEQRLAEDRAIAVAAGEEGQDGEGEEGEKGKWRFMQKYYHKGAFYMDEDTLKRSGGAADVRAKDYAAAPTLEDRVDKQQLPKVLQVKNFGKRGRTKYTHLLDQDTTIAPQQQQEQQQQQQHKRIDRKPDRSIMDKYLQRRSGVGKL